MRRVLKSKPVFVMSLVLGLASLLAAGSCWTKYTLDGRELHKLSVRFLSGPDKEEGLKQLMHFVATSCNHPVDPETAGLAARLEQLLPLNLSAMTVLREGYAFPGAKRFGPCGSMSRVIGAVARRQNMPVRMVLLDNPGAGEHKMVAVWIDGGYRLLDPTFDHYWVNEEGRIATIEEVRDNPEIFAQIYEKHPNYPYRLEDVLYFRWSRLGPLMRPAQAVVRLFVGEKGVAEMDTPKVIEEPWYGYGWASFVLSLPFLGLAWYARPRGPRPGTVEERANLAEGPPGASAA